MIEKWKPIIGLETSHQVSTHGRIKRIVHAQGRGKNAIYSYSNDRPTRYTEVILSHNGKRLRDSLHRIVAIAFLPNPLKKPTVNHIDNNRSNNHVSNLEWATHKENTQHAVKQKRMAHGEGQPSHLLTEEQVQEILKTNLSTRQLARLCGVSQNAIVRVKRGITWKHLLEAM